MSDIDLTADSKYVEHGDGVYANAEKAASEGTFLHAQDGDSSDEVDPRKLVRDPTLSEIRWYYRRTFANVLVDKPIDDAFKNGFEVTSDNAEEAESLLREPEFDEDDGDGFIGAYRFAEKKARRDGFSLVYIGTKERGSAGTHESPIDESVDVADITHFKVLTVDDLASNAPYDQIEEATGLGPEQYEVRKTGIVINTDISSRKFRQPIGYVLDSAEPQFVHADRVIHLTWRPEVDGDYHSSHGIRRYEYASDDSTYLGAYEGDSVLIPSYDILKGITKGNWSITQALFRDAANMYSVKLPNDADERDFGAAVGATRNINAKSALVWPSTDYEIDQHDSGGQMEPEQHFDVLFDQVCAGQEMTKSVLFGTQAGTVSGSETDIKNYFNKVERYRSNRAESKIDEYLTRAKQMLDSRTSADFQYDVDIRWGPLFKLDKQTRIETLQNGTQALATLIGSYALTPDEAREVLTEDFVEMELDDMTESQMDELDRINLTNMGQGESAIRSEGEYTSAPGPGAASSTASNAEGGRSGGMEQGQTTAQSNPTGDSEESIVADLERLSALHDDGALTEEEYEAAKERLLEA